MNRNRPFDNHFDNQYPQDQNHYQPYRDEFNDGSDEDRFARNPELPNSRQYGMNDNFQRDYEARDYRNQQGDIMRNWGNRSNDRVNDRFSDNKRDIRGGDGNFGSPSDYQSSGAGLNNGGYYGSGSGIRSARFSEYEKLNNEISGNFNGRPPSDFNPLHEDGPTGYRSAYTQGRFDYDATYQDDRNSNNYRQGSYGELAHRSKYANHNQGGGSFFGGPDYDPSEAAYGSDKRSYPSESEGISENRNWISKAADQVLSWAGNHEADRRRRLDRFSGDTYYSTESSNRLDFD